MNIAHLESLRASCVAAVTSCQAAVQHIEALIADADKTADEQTPADDYSHLTFEDTPQPIRRKNGQR